jgi:hypothetical protein
LLMVVIAVESFAQSGSAWQLLVPAHSDEVFQFAEQYNAYLKVARSALTSTAEIIRIAEARGQRRRSGQR